MRSASAFDTPAASATASIISAFVAMESSFGWVLILFTPVNRTEANSAFIAAEYDHENDRGDLLSSTKQIALATTKSPTPYR